MDLSNIDILELVDRYNNLIKFYTELALEIAPKLDKFGKYKKELEILTVEFVKRGFKVEEPDSLKRMVEEELAKRNILENGK